MEKNHRFSNQSLSSKGANTEPKKTQETAKWPRHSKRREQPNFSDSKADTYRGGNGKASASGKARNQTNYSYNSNDKRTKQQQRPSPPLDAETSLLESSDPFDEQFEGAGLVSAYDARGSIPVRHELHSVFSSGSKKQSLNHLLNFHYAPRERDQPVRFTKTGNNRSHIKKMSYNKEQFLQANCQFVVRANEDYGAFLASPDLLVDWAKIEQIHILSSEEPQCPICLYPPVAAKMTKCGHVYCWPCILHYLALSDKTWRKCPICYDAIHIPDLRSAVSKPFHCYALDEFVTFQLMRREKASMGVAIGTVVQEHKTEIPHFQAQTGNTILSKLLLADTEQILNIVAREQQELENQIVTDGIHCPENVFVQQALDQLKERKETILGAKPIFFSDKKKQQEASSINKPRMVEEINTEAVDCTMKQQERNPASAIDYLIDEDSNFSLSDIEIVQTTQCASSDYLYFYQSMDGQPLFLHSINTRMLQAMYGGLDRAPPKLTGKIVQKDSCSMSEMLRKKLKYLQHLPVCTQFEVAEIEFGEDIIAPEILCEFKDELNRRHKDRQKRARAERIREKQIFEFNERQLGKSLARSAKINIGSTKQFPSCGAGDGFDFRYEPSSAASPPVSDISSASPGSSSVGPSWSKMLSATSAGSRWPSLPSGSGSMNTFAPLATPPPKLLQITGSKMGATYSAGRKLATDSDAEEDPENLLDEARVPEFRNDLSFAIEAALERATLNCDSGNSSTMDGCTKKTKSASGNGSGMNQSAKKKKNKKTLLFASGMTLN
ncbi:RING finger protein 10 [Uranotaenia lowii]|uniref:RING finger protein 10 n=1 Tax=Uranotaenia lowii TaxID=190385 RepID=UPI0024798998|nr:RING finger protein 10 [Uranotaenia lowii]